MYCWSGIIWNWDCWSRVLCGPIIVYFLTKLTHTCACAAAGDKLQEQLTWQGSNYRREHLHRQAPSVPSFAILQMWKKPLVMFQVTYMPMPNIKGKKKKSLKIKQISLEALKPRHTGHQWMQIWGKNKRKKYAQMGSKSPRWTSTKALAKWLPELW